MYTIEQLSKPETYKTDKKLFAMARAIATKQYSDHAQWLPYKNEITDGKHPQIVLDYLKSLQAAEAEATKTLFARNFLVAEAIEKLQAMQLPAGIAFELNDGGYITVTAPWDGADLAQRLGRIGGKWNREQKCFRVPLDGVKSLPAIFSNWNKAQQQRQAEQAEQKRQQAAAREKAQQERQAQWAAQRQADNLAYQQQRQQREAARKQQAKAVANRIRVKVGEYKIGDMLEGKPITGFGKSWEEATLSAGQLYQPCDFGRCEGEPVCVRCFMCEKHCGCDTETVCYAYFD